MPFKFSIRNVYVADNSADECQWNGINSIVDGSDLGLALLAVSFVCYVRLDLHSRLFGNYLKWEKEKRNDLEADKTSIPRA